MERGTLRRGAVLREKPPVRAVYSAAFSSNPFSIMSEGTIG